jgi:hypothetical protein
MICTNLSRVRFNTVLKMSITGTFLPQLCWAKVPASQDTTINTIPMDNPSQPFKYARLKTGRAQIRLLEVLLNQQLLTEIQMFVFSFIFSISRCCITLLIWLGMWLSASLAAHNHKKEIYCVCTSVEAKELIDDIKNENTTMYDMII